jgi:nicotine oxidoreductase
MKHRHKKKKNNKQITTINFMPKKITQRIKPLRSQIVFSKKIAIRLTRSQYYMVLGEDIRNLPSRETEKRKYATPKQERVSELIKHYKTLYSKKSNGIFYIMKGIYNTNANAATNGHLPPIHSNLLSLVASIPSLIIAYRSIRKNKGATTLGAMLSFQRNRKLNPIQRRLMSSTTLAPDGLSYAIFKRTSDLLKQGKYPWGASRRIYIEKPGQPGKMRPLTIPPFMDRVVQTSILRTLESIYEPWFEIQNRSFGFRSKKGVHDAIYALTRQENKGLYTAIEGDIKGAYDNVDRTRLIEILSKRIKDRKFIRLITNRLDYEYYDTVTGKYVTEEKGIPQGGIDSPYLWNIYMNEFDNHIKNYMENLLYVLNEKIRLKKNKSGLLNPRTKVLLKSVSRLIIKRRSTEKELKLLQSINTKEKYDLIMGDKNFPKGKKQSIRMYLKKDYADPENLTPNPDLGLIPPSSKRYNLIKTIKRIRHDLRNLPATDPNKAVLRYQYVRYADDWIILGNYPRMLAEKIKSHIKEWLRNNLSAELAEEKTLITDIRNPITPAHFLGFELRSFTTRKLAYKMTGNSSKPELTRVAGSEVKVAGSEVKVAGSEVKVAGSEVKSYPDQQRLISRLNMKGYCDKRGRPIPMSWISTLETFALISRFNAVLLGIGNFYYGFVPKSSLNRWIYIIRFCLLKTLAQKYNTNIKNIFTRFGIRTPTGNTIQYKVTNTFYVNGVKKVMEKTWTLLTELELQEKCLLNKRFNTVKQNFNIIEFDRKFPPPLGGQDIVSIKDDDWVNKIMWVNLRTQSSFDLPCCRCGSTTNIQMHHIKHIRKVLYSKFPKDKPHLNIMALRNRKQIPVCRECHMNVIHKGRYTGANLKTLLPVGNETKKGYDNRLINIENYINPSDKEYFGKSLEEKGWKQVVQDYEQE